MSPMNPGLHPKSWPPYQDRVYDVKQPSNKAFSMTDKPEKPKSRRISFTGEEMQIMEIIFTALTHNTEAFLAVFEGELQLGEKYHLTADIAEKLDER